MLQSEKTFRREIFNYLRKIPKIHNENEKQFTLIFFVLRNFNYMNPRMLLYAFFKTLRSISGIGDDRARSLDDIFHIKQHETTDVCRYIFFVTTRELVSKLKKLEESLKIGRRDINDEDYSAIYDLFENRLQYLSNARSVTDDENERPLQSELGSEKPLQMELGSDSDSDISVTLIDSD
jgi:hypothetical protein